MTYLPYLAAAVSVLSLLYNVFFGPSRAERKALDKSIDERLHKQEMQTSNHENRLTGFQLEIERVADASDKRCHAIEAQLGEVPRLREDFAGMKAEVKHLTEGMGEVKRTLEKVYDLLTKRTQ